MFNPTNLSFRYIVNPEDLQAVEYLLLSLKEWFSEEEITVALELIQETLDKGDSSDYYFCFAEYDNRVIGYSSYGPIPFTQNRYDLYWIAVDYNSRQNGIGKRILQKTEKDILNHNGTCLYVDTSGKERYTSTRKFYESQGYVLETVIKDFYADGDDKYIYSKKLKF